MTMSEPRGYLCMVLHAHLPYVRHPEYEYCLEENWLYEAMTESYIPLIDLFSRLIDDGSEFRVTLSLSPTLAEMLGDELLMKRYVIYLERLIELATMECRRNRRGPLEPIIKMYRSRFKRIRCLFEQTCRGDLISALKELQETGHLEIIPSAATHAYLPHLCLYPEAVRAQIGVAMQQYKYNFHRSPQGIWFPECGFASEFDEYVREQGISFFFLDSHGVIRGVPSPEFGAYLPVLCRSGISVFGRDASASRQVWSSISGYPGDADYRDFYRDIGFDSGDDHVRSFLMPYAARTFTGLKYYRITGATDSKKPYIAERAIRKVKQHAHHYMVSREAQVHSLFERYGIRPVITAAFDAELFGHWWFEGVDWLDMLFRNIDRKGRNFCTITPSEYLGLQGQNSALQLSHPSASSWGANGYHEVWLNDRNDHIYRHMLKAAGRMIGLADRFPDAGGVLLRALNQAAREILLSQHSDWTFMMRNDSFREYAEKRFAVHISRFTNLHGSIMSGHIDEGMLTDMEHKDAIFGEIDYRIFRSLSPLEGN